MIYLCWEMVQNEHISRARALAPKTENFFDRLPHEIFRFRLSIQKMGDVRIYIDTSQDFTEGVLFVYLQFLHPTHTYK